MKRLLTLLFLAIALTACSHTSALTSFAQHKPAQTDSIKVWVNTSTGVYHCPGTQWYGKTKAGAYMSQKAAQDKGNRPAYGKVCG